MGNLHQFILLLLYYYITILLYYYITKLLYYYITIILLLLVLSLVYHMRTLRTATSIYQVVNMAHMISYVPVKKIVDSNPSWPGHGRIETSLSPGLPIHLRFASFIVSTGAPELDESLCKSPVTHGPHR